MARRERRAEREAVQRKVEEEAKARAAAAKALAEAEDAAAHQTASLALQDFHLSLTRGVASDKSARRPVSFDQRL